MVRLRAQWASRFAADKRDGGDYRRANVPMSVDDVKAELAKQAAALPAGIGVCIRW
jgi:hypothetical protein